MGSAPSPTTLDDPDGDAIELPSIATVDRLIEWHRHRAAADGRLALSLEAEQLSVAADTNRRRAKAHRQTALCLRALRHRLQPPAPAVRGEYRGHLQPKTRTTAQVRAPP